MERQPKYTAYDKFKDVSYETDKKLKNKEQASKNKLLLQSNKENKTN